MNDLRVVNLNSNKISSLSAFNFIREEGPFLPFLQLLYMQNNLLSDVTEVSILQKFNSLTALDVRGNPISQDYTQLKKKIFDTTVRTLNGVRIRNCLGL